MTLCLRELKLNHAHMRTLIAMFKHETNSFLSFSQKILEYVSNVDLILLDLHGAIVTETCTDAEGLLLETLRAIAPDTPIAVALDFHANISDVMVAHADIITGYHTYPPHRYEANRLKSRSTS